MENKHFNFSYQLHHEFFTYPLCIFKLTRPYALRTDVIIYIATGAT